MGQIAASNALLSSISLIALVAVETHPVKFVNFISVTKLLHIILDYLPLFILKLHAVCDGEHLIKSYSRPPLLWA